MTRRLHNTKHYLGLSLGVMVALLGFSLSLSAQIQITFSTQEPSCFGLPNGSVSALPTDGVPPYTYLWNTGDSGQTLSGVTAGTYSVTVTDANSLTGSSSVVLTQPDRVTATLTTDQDCSAPFDITANGDGGVAPYTYNWSNGAMTQTLLNVPDGEYCVTVVDSRLCGVLECITVTTSGPAVSVQATNVTCPGGSNGSLTATPSGGVPPYTYQWSNGGNTQTINNLTAATYFVTLTDANGCTAVASGLVSQPPPLIANLSINQPDCVGDNDGNISVVASGGTPNYTYQWSTGQTTSSIFGLAPGTYIVTITDANNCELVRQIPITPRSNLTVGAVGTPETCPGFNDGFATANPQGGVRPYSYQWNTGQTEQVIMNAVPGTYTVTVTDAAGCMGVASAIVLPATPLLVEVAGSNPSTCGVNDGSATAMVNSGTGPFTYRWNTGATLQTITGLGAGTYTVTVTDVNDCTSTASTTLVAPPDVFVNATATPLVCPGGNNGQATATASAGTPPYTYAWSTGASGASIFNLGPGNYSVTVTDANGCTDVDFVTISQAPGVTVSLAGTEIVCGADNTGSATATPTSGTAPFSYSWSNGANSQTVTGLVAGTYTVTVTDANGCTDEESITIRVVDDLTVNLLPRPVLCFGGNSGSVLAQVVGGDAPYVYAWSNNAGNTPELLNLVAGTYTVTVTDANGCVATATTTVTQPSRLVASATGTDPACPAETSGTAMANATGGTPPYQYAWNTGSSAQSLTDLSAGTYLVTVTDANLCTATASLTLTDPDPLSVNVSAPTISCGGTATGSATAIVTGGTTPYAYAWSDGQSTQTAVNLSAGTYQLTVTDANGCTQVVPTIILSELPAVAIDFNITNIECTDAAVGAITAVASNGTPPYAYSWSNGQSGPTITGLAAGTYTVTVTDANGCRAVRGATVGQTAGFTAGAPGVNISCLGANDGSATAVPNGGQAPFAYNWSTGATTTTIMDLGPGTYSVTITDANECFATASVIIQEPAELVVNVVGDDIDCGDTPDGSAVANVSGGTPPYTYNWNTGATTSSLGSLGAGTYMVTVTDANGCTASGSRTITAPPVLTVDITQNSGTCTNADEGILVANVLGGTAPFQYRWNNGATTSTISNLAAGTYTVTVTDANGCTQTATAGLTVFPAPTCSVVVDQVADLGNNGQVTVTVNGGTAPFSYTWSNGGNTATIGNLSPGTYTVTVADANGCQTNCSATLEPLAGIGNYVWEDIDHDGQQDPDEPVIPGVTVELKDANGNVIATTVTDANGEYYFLGLDPGSYSVRFVIPDGLDYTASNQGDDTLDSDIVAGMNGMTEIYVLDPGELDFTVDGGLYVPPNGVIGDPCQCLNNSTTEDDGQFTETFTVRSYPNETWIIIDGEGMWTAPNGDPPVAPVPVTFPQTMTEVSPGVYEFTFRLVDEISYTVVTTNNFDTLSISNVCEYPTVNVEELPPAELCLADDPIELGANPNIPGNMIFTINGEITTTIDPILLDTGSFELISRLIPLNPSECEATIVTQFTIDAECLATVGDRVWLDLNCDGIQGGNEPGVPGVEVTITGTAEFFDPNLTQTTFTDANGNFEFMVPPGNYKLTFGQVPGYELTAPNQGTNDELDSDVDPLNFMTEIFRLEPDEVNLSFDMGLCPECINIDYPGAIGFDQYLCAPGNDPEPFVSLAEPTGGDGPIEYLWMSTAGTPNAPIQTWQPIPNSDSPTYDPGPLFQTTYFARCARVVECGPFLESNILEVTVGNEAGGEIFSPGIACYNEPVTFEAVNLTNGGSVRWNFGPNATPSTATGRRATTTFSGVGNFEVEMIVTVGECTAYVYDRITITTLPTVCNQGLLLDATITDNLLGQVVLDWEMSASFEPLDYLVEFSDDGLEFATIDRVSEETLRLNGIRYYEYATVAPKKGRNYYRVKVVDSAGNAVESNVVEVIIFTESKIAMLYPNPVEGQLTVEIFETFDATTVSLEVFAVSGKRMATIPVDGGAKNVQLDMSTYPAGVYLVQLRLDETNIRTMKVIKR